MTRRRGLFSGDTVDGVGFDGISAFLLNNGLLKIDYFLEIMRDGKSEVVMSLPEQPQSVDFSFQYAERITYTFDDTVTFRELGKARTGMVVISGEISNKARLALFYEGIISYTPNLRNMTGEDVLLNFKYFLEEYYDSSSYLRNPANISLLALKNQLDSDKQPTLIFRALKENVHYKARVDSFTFGKSIDKKRLAGFTWQLVLQLYDPVTPTEPGIIQSVFDGITDAINFVTTYPLFVGQAIDTLTNSVDVGFSGVQNALVGLGSAVENIGVASNNAVASVLRNTAETMDAVGAAIDGVYGAIDAFSSIGDTASIGGNQVSSSFDRFMKRSMLSKLFEKDLPPPIPEVGEIVTRQFPPDLEQNTQALVTAFQLQEYTSAMENILGITGTYNNNVSRLLDGDTRGLLASPQGFGYLATLYGAGAGTPDTVSQQSFTGPTIEYVMRAGESLLTVANRLLGSPDDWIVLAQINACLDAYTLGDGTPIISGSRIQVPVTGELFPHSLGVNPANREFAAQNLYGIDIDLSVDGDIVFSNNLDDVRTSRGDANLRQAIIMMLRTISNEVTLSPELGTPLNTLIGTKFTQQGATYIAVKIREALVRDSRIADVLDITVESDVPSAITISMKIITTLGDSLRVATTV